MHGCLPADPQRAIFAADSSVTERLAAAVAADVETFSDSSVTEPGDDWFARICKRLWKLKSDDKPAAALDMLTSAKLHQCYRYASGRQQPPATLIVELLRGADGERFMQAVMRGCKAPWWLRWCRARAIADGVDRAVEQYELDFK